MVSLRAIASGEDLLLSYGRLDNTLLLLDYGTASPRVLQVSTNGPCGLNNSCATHVTATLHSR